MAIALKKIEQALEYTKSYMQSRWGIPIMLVLLTITISIKCVAYICTCVRGILKNLFLITLSCSLASFRFPPSYIYSLYFCVKVSSVRVVTAWLIALGTFNCSDDMEHQRQQ